MAKNDFKPFATGKGANVTSQPDWEALPALLSGFTAGKASSAQVNKALRQASFIAAALAQYTASKSGQDVLDDGDLSGFIAKMSAAFGKDFQTIDATLTALAGLATGADKLPYFTGNDTAGQTDLTSVGRDIIGKASIADILTYLGLEETAKQAAGALQKSQNGGDIPNKPLFIENLGLKETLNPTKRVSIGYIGTGAFDGSTPCINIGDSDSGFIGSADGVIDIYCNNAKVGYIDSSGIHLNDQGLHIGDARMGSDGNIWGTRWNASGQWLWDAIVEQLNTRGTIDWINNQLSIRDRNINARAAISQVIGIGQTYRVVTDKLLGVTYTNTSQKPWVVVLKINLPTSGEVQIKVNGVMAAGGNTSNISGIAVWAYPSAIVPAGATYVVESAWGNVIQWVELQ
ncbi:gp53-like domain-containing protein [Salmonella enterica]|uniref:gp53-like domain-containing protein n=1 Tax=Salmonella enterica TaxID=28901 RepID=UPI003D3111BA